MESKMHKLFLTRCDERPEGGMVSAAECGACPHGSVVDNNSRVICYGATKFFYVPCYYEMKSSATVSECEACPWGVVSDDRSRVFCNRI
ncbi:MAG: hypothetical protein AB7S97_05340 [Thermoplasmata archaeon]